MYHTPALLNECIQGLNINLDGTYADVTFGGGGHAREILKRLGENGRLFGFDQDQDAVRDGNGFTENTSEKVLDHVERLPSVLRTTPMPPAQPEMR